MLGITVVGALALAGPLAGPARAGTVEILSCDLARGGANKAWVPHAERGIKTAERCPSQGRAGRGLRVSAPSDGAIRSGARSYWRFTAPRGTTLRSMSFAGRGQRSKDEYAVGIRAAAGDYLFGYGEREGPAKVRFGDGPKGAATTLDLGGSRSVEIAVACAANAKRCSGGASISVHGTRVTIDDPVAPRVTTPLRNGARPRAGTRVSFDASDNLGIREARLLVDGQPKDRATYRCDTSRPVPCRNLRAERLRLDTAPLPAGQHTLGLVVVDAAGNESSLERTILVGGGRDPSGRVPAEERNDGEGAPGRGTPGQGTPGQGAPGQSEGTSASLRASRRTVRNGSVVTFRGNVKANGAGRAGVLVSMQARVGRRWVTFRVVRTNSAGSFGARYRFQRTFRTQTYAFRAHVPAQGAFTPGTDSRTVRVRVLGR